MKKYNLTSRENICCLINEFNNDLKNNGTLPELNKWLVTMIETLIEEMAHTGVIFRAKQYINQNYDKNISLGDVAKYSGISESYLSREFRNKTGDSFSNYILKVRMNKAIELIKNSNLKIYEIAEKVGFNNAEYFSKQFKKVMGKSPKNF